MAQSRIEPSLYPPPRFREYVEWLKLRIREMNYRYWLKVRSDCKRHESRLRHLEKMIEMHIPEDKWKDLGYYGAGSFTTYRSIVACLTPRDWLKLLRK